MDIFQITTVRIGQPPTIAIMRNQCIGFFVIAVGVTLTEEVAHLDDIVRQRVHEILNHVRVFCPHVAPCSISKHTRYVFVFRHGNGMIHPPLSHFRNGVIVKAPIATIIPTFFCQINAVAVTHCHVLQPINIERIDLSSPVCI